jgi:hypothetical protein
MARLASECSTYGQVTSREHTEQGAQALGTTLGARDEEFVSECVNLCTEVVVPAEDCFERADNITGSKVLAAVVAADAVVVVVAAVVVVVGVEGADAIVDKAVASVLAGGGATSRCSCCRCRCCCSSPIALGQAPPGPVTSATVSIAID